MRPTELHSGPWFDTNTTLIRLLQQNAEDFPDRVAMREKS